MMDMNTAELFSGDVVANELKALTRRAEGVLAVVSL